MIFINNFCPTPLVNSDFNAQFLCPTPLVDSDFHAQFLHKNFIAMRYLYYSHSAPRKDRTRMSNFCGGLLSLGHRQNFFRWGHKVKTPTSSQPPPPPPPSFSSVFYFIFPSSSFFRSLWDEGCGVPTSLTTPTERIRIPFNCLIFRILIPLQITFFLLL